MKGKVYLVGAGPGDPKLLTLRAWEVLQKAQVVLYDRLVSAEVLQLANPAAELVYVGKHGGEQQQVQSQIEELLLEFSGRGLEAVRLKGGDPMIFGRGGEEWLFLAQHGIEVEIVPGLSSALSLPALAAIPLTYRGLAQSLAVVTGHAHQGIPDFKCYARIETLVVLMGVQERAQIAQALIAAGRPPDEPTAFIENGATPKERIVEATLTEVAQGETEVNSPAVWIIGPVVAMRPAILAARNRSNLP